MVTHYEEKVYCALPTRHDGNVGRLMGTLSGTGAKKDTIIMWSSDNGDENSYYKTNTFNGNGPFRAAKRSLHEGGIRVPLGLRVYGGFRSESVSIVMPTDLARLDSAVSFLVALSSPDERTRLGQ